MAKHKRIVLYSWIFSLIILIVELVMPFAAPETIFPSGTNYNNNTPWIMLIYYLVFFVVFLATAFFEMEQSRLVDFWKLAGLIILLSLALSILPMSIHFVTFNKYNKAWGWGSTVTLFILLYLLLVWGISQTYKLIMVFGIKKNDSITEFTSRFALYFFYRNIKVSSNNNFIILTRGKKQVNVMYINQTNKISKLKFPTFEDSSTDSLVDDLLHFRNVPVILVYEQEDMPAITGEVPDNIYIQNFSEFRNSISKVLNGKEN